MRALRLPFLLLWPLLLAAPAPAFAPAAAPDPDAVTVIGTGTLGRSTLLVRGGTERVSTLPYGVEMATIKVTEVLWADLPGRKPATVSVLSNEIGFFAKVSGDSLLFLRRLEGRERFECEGIVDLSDRDGPARLAGVRRSLEIEALPAGQRAAALRRSCFESLGDPDPWTRRNAGREIAHLAVLRPAAFSEADAREVADLAFQEGDRILRPFLVEAAETLAKARDRDALAPAEQGRVSLRGAPAFRALREEKDPKRRLDAVGGVGAEPGETADAALAGALLEDPAAAVRAAAAEALGGRPSSALGVKALLGVLAAEGDAAVRAAAAGALGSLRVQDGVPVLRRLCGEPAPLGRAALFALARIGSPGAQAAVREFGASRDPEREETAGMRELVEFLLSEDFRKQEEALRRMREK